MSQLDDPGTSNHWWLEILTFDHWKTIIENKIKIFNFQIYIYLLQYFTQVNNVIYLFPKCKISTKRIIVLITRRIPTLRSLTHIHITISSSLFKIFPIFLIHQAFHHPKKVSRFKFFMLSSSTLLPLLLSGVCMLRSTD